MSLEESLKELREQVAEAQKQEEQAQEPHEEEAKEEEAGEPEEEQVEEETKEAEKEEDSPKEPEKTEEKLDDSAYARLRRERAAEKKRADELERRLADLETKSNGVDRPSEAQEDGDAQSQLPEDLDSMVMEHRLMRAEREFKSLEGEFQASVPDYGNVAKEYTAALARSIQIQNPRLPQEAVIEKTRLTILQKAGAYVRQGYNPVEELYHEAKELGFTGKTVQQQAEPKEDKPQPKPDMNRVAANRARSAGTAGASGESRGQMTRQAAADLSPAEWQALPKEEKLRLLNNAH